MFYRHRGGSAQSLMLRTGYALLSGQLTANGTQLTRPAIPVGLFAVRKIFGRPSAHSANGFVRHCDSHGVPFLSPPLSVFGQFGWKTFALGGLPRFG